MKEITLTRGKVTLVDNEDYEWLSGFKWYCSPDRNGIGYAVRGVKTCGKIKTIAMHRVIMDCPQDMVVDHINHDTLDNRKENLRICTRTENQRNRKISTWKKFKGVYKRGFHYYAEIANKKLGTYVTPEEAARAYDFAARRMFGNFALLNFSNEQLEQKPIPIGKKKKVSPYKGVSIVNKKYIARIRVKGKMIYLGCYATPEEAAQAYDLKAMELLNNLAILNFMEEKDK